MRASLRSYMGNAVVTYEEKPRDSWLFEYVFIQFSSHGKFTLVSRILIPVIFLSNSYPAQVSLCGTQIWWTTEGTLISCYL